MRLVMPKTSGRRERRFLVAMTTAGFLLATTATLQGFIWTLERPDPNSGGGNGVSVAVDGNSRPRVAYTVGSGELRYLKYSGTSWGSPILIDTAAKTVSLAYRSASGTAFIAYGKNQLDFQGDVYLATYADGTGVVAASEVGTGPDNKHPRVALTAAGGPVIAYHHSLTGLGGPPRELYCSGGASPLASGFNNLGGWEPGLALDSHGHVHVTFHDGYQSGPDSLAYSPADTSEFGPVHHFGWRGYASDIALDASDRPHIVSNAYTDGCYYTFWNGSAWSPRIDLHNAGNGCGIAVDGFGTSHVASCGIGGLVYSQIDASGGLVLQQSIVSGYQVNMCDIVLGSGEMPVIAFLDNTRALVVAQAIPEPATVSLLALGGLAVMRRRRR